MNELDPEITETAEMLERAAKALGTHRFAALSAEGQYILGCASLCVFDSPTGRKANVEDVVVGSGFRGQGIGRALMEYIIDFARRELGDVDRNLTARPEGVEAKERYWEVGLRGGGRMYIG